MRTSTKKPRGRPRQYNPEAALRQALEVFWEKGYASTSLDDLASATGLNRPSLYAGFGNKESLYLRALERFRKDLSEKLEEQLRLRGESDTVVNALDRFFSTLIDVYTSRSRPLGCAVFCTAVSEAPSHIAVREELLASLEYGDKKLKAFLVDAQRRRALPADSDLDRLADILCAVHHSLALRSRAGQAKARLRNLVKSALRLVV